MQEDRGELEGCRLVGRPRAAAGRPEPNLGQILSRWIPKKRFDPSVGAPIAELIKVTSKALRFGVDALQLRMHQLLGEPVPTHVSRHENGGAGHWAVIRYQVAV